MTPRPAPGKTEPERLLNSIKSPPDRNDPGQAQALDEARALALYDELTEGRSERLRVEELLERAAPGGPRAAALAQGRLVAAWLADRSTGTHLIESMLRPKPESIALLSEYRSAGSVELGVARVERRAGMGVVTVTRSARLNAENGETTRALETAVDLVLLDPGSEVGVLRGGVVEHPRYGGRRVFSSGLDLSELYAGELSYLFFVVRELGLVAKMQRGASDPACDGWLEKPWIAGVETFAIGGGAQLLLVMDRVIAERGALLSFPASREGIIPGAAPLRLPAFVGRSAARRAIMFAEEWRAQEPPGSEIVDEVVEPGEVGGALEEAAATLLATGPASVIANRRALRDAQEPLDAFRGYMSTYAIEQARCYASDALMANLERTWVNRR